MDELDKHKQFLVLSDRQKFAPHLNDQFQRYRERKLLILYQKHIASIKNHNQKSAKYKTKVASYAPKKAKTEAIWSNTSTLQVADGDEDWLNKNVIFWFVSDLVEKTRRAAKIEIR